MTDRGTLQLRIFVRAEERYRTLEVDDLWMEVGPNDHDQIGFQVFWHGEQDVREFDFTGVALDGGGSLIDLFHDVGCVVPSDFPQVLTWALGEARWGVQLGYGEPPLNARRVSEMLGNLINDTTALRDKIGDRD